MNETVNNEIERDDESGLISYANDVVATIASVSTLEVEGISGIAGVGRLDTLLSKGKTPRAVKVDIKDGNVSVDVSVKVDYGTPIQKVGRSAQENVRKSIESMTGLHVEKVDLHVVGVNFDKEKAELEQSQQFANVTTPDEEKTADAEDTEEIETAPVEFSLESEKAEIPEEDEDNEEPETESKDEE